MSGTMDAASIAARLDRLPATRSVWKLVILLALGMFLKPFGASGNPGAIFDQLGKVAEGIKVGNVWISPGAILQGLVVLFVGADLVVLGLWLKLRRSLSAAQKAPA